MKTTFLRVLLALGVAAGLAACPEENPTLQQDDASAHGPVTVKVVDPDGLPVAGLDVVFHGPDGKPVHSTVTAADGQATEVMDSGGGVTVVDLSSELLDRHITSALGVPAGATVLVRAVRGRPLEEFQPSPRLPPLPDLPQMGEAPLIVVEMMCHGRNPGNFATRSGPVKIYGSRSCIGPDGTYAVEASISLRGGLSYYTRRAGIPSTDLAPELPAWRDDIGLFRRRIARAGLWRVTATMPFAGSTSMTGGVMLGDERYLETLGPADGPLVFEGNASVAGADLRVRLEQSPPHAATGMLDFERERLRAVRNVQLASDARPFELAWDETSDGLAPRFVIAAVTWSNSRIEPTPEVASAGAWNVILPAGSRRVVFPELPAALGRHLPPKDIGGTAFVGTVNLVDDTGVTGYGELLAEDPLRSISMPPPGERDRIVRLATARAYSSQDAPRAKGVTIATEPAASGRWVRLTAGSPLRLTAHVEGSGDQRVTWIAFPQPASLETAGASATLRADVPGRTIVVRASSAADPRIQEEVFVDVVPPACMSTWPALHPPRPRAQIAHAPHLPVAVRRDGTPIVALATLEGLFNRDVRVNAVAWDGVDWTDLAPPLEVQGWQQVQRADSPVAMVLDGQDRPILAVLDQSQIELHRLESGAWHELTTPIAAPVAGDLVLALDPAGDPVVATTLRSGLRDSAGTVWRWKGGKWSGRTAYVSANTTDYLRVRSLVMDGDVPIVTFEGSGGPRVVRLDDEVIDLGPFDADATGYATPLPLLAMPAAGQPLVAWLDPVTGGSAADLVVRAAQRGPRGWEPFGEALAIPRADAPPHALVWDPAARRAVVATGAPADGTAQVRALGVSGLLCAPLVDPDAGPFAAVRTIGMALDPAGGYVVATGMTSYASPHLTVHRILP